MKRRHVLACGMHQPVKPEIVETLPPVPGWLRRDPPTDAAEAAFRAGAALAVLDARVRADAPFAGVWRRRLALTAAAASTRQIRRGEEEAQLRDALFLRTQASDDPGPAGRLLMAWRGLDRALARPGELAEDAILHVATILNLQADDALRAAIVAAIACARSDVSAAPFAAVAAARAVLHHRPDAELLALWLADAVLAARLKWPWPLPLMASALAYPSLRVGPRRPHPGDAAWTASCCAAYALAAVRACDLFADLAHRSQKLVLVSKQLRAKGAGKVIDALHDDDAVASGQKINGISDRGLRRLFDRLVALGAVRELTGRASFRLYGL
jgi:hypothetical protein